jgi:outer membrane protein assembly complex protein YaeT
LVHGFVLLAVHFDPQHRFSQTTRYLGATSVPLSSSVQGAILVRWHGATICFALFLLAAIPASPQVKSIQPVPRFDPLTESAAPVVDEVRFEGLRHLFPAALAAQITTRAGDRLDLRVIDRDVRALARLGWFKSIAVEQASSISSPSPVAQSQGHIALVFVLEEWPFLTEVEYSGSRLLSSQQIEKILEERKIVPSLGRPVDPVTLQRIAGVIRSSLNQLGHPEPQVRILITEAPNATLSARFQIDDDGPHLPVRRVKFVGNPQLSDKSLRAQMHSIAPWRPFSALRGKDAYTREAFEEDRSRVLEYFRNHGYPEARIGNPQISKIDDATRAWLPWWHHSLRAGLSLSIPVQAGPFYRFDSVLPSPVLKQAVNRPGQKSREDVCKVAVSEANKPYSSEEVEKLRRWWQTQLPPANSTNTSDFSPVVEALQSFDAENHTARVNFNLSDAPPYIVQRIEFLGLHRFSDRYVRKRLPLREGQPVNDRALEAGLARLARTGYFRQIHKEDIHIHLDESTRTANISIRLEEAGRQRTSLSGGTSQFGNTLGIAYTVFDLLHREELLSAQLDGGPESLQIMLGLAEEGIFGTKGSLAFSVFDNVVRPRFAKGVQGPFFNSYTEGISIPWTYPLTNNDSLGLTYTLSRTATEIPPGASSAQSSHSSSVSIDPHIHTSSHSLGAGWIRDSGDQRILFSDSASGGVLGGSENILRSSGEYSRITRDPVFSPANSWAFRTSFNGAGSYCGDMPFYSRLFPGDELVRGFRPGELGPHALSASITPSGATTYRPTAAGANLVAASNAEYRMPVAPGTQVTGFFDAGSGWLFPNWLGPTKPTLLGQTNGVLHASTGVELRWNIPGIQVPLRAYYAVNVARLDRAIHLSDKSIFFAHNRFSAFGWGLGSLF